MDKLKKKKEEQMKHKNDKKMAAKFTMHEKKNRSVNNGDRKCSFFNFFLTKVVHPCPMR